jgi:O-antigen/teichoic acid export membrane protein
LCLILPAGLALFHELSYQSGATGFVLYVLPYLVGHLLVAQWFHQGMSDLMQVSAILALTRLVYLVAAVLLVERPGDLPMLLAVNATAMLAAGLAMGIGRSRRHGTGLRMDPVQGWSELKRGANVFVGDFAPNLYNNLPHLFLAGAVSPVVYGAYMASVRILAAAQSAMYTITHAYFPRLASRGPESRRTYVALCVGTAVVLAAILALFADRLVAVLLSPDLADAAAYLEITSVGLVFVAIALVAGPGTLLVKGRDVTYRNASLMLSVAGGAAALLAVPLWGAWGAATVVLATRIAIAMVMWMLGARA